ncbi:hypothetical protein CRM22_000236 [Opisthorchis felineus]|uniref:Uncharacterized protein n=1 Tax=Opisthorchis felineus TaxID=147828 RepID=A0A4S2MG83_OPIFE|nr:hypothetical protein CRM22_000236 [Opisthorchis felineus]
MNAAHEVKTTLQPKKWHPKVVKIKSTLGFSMSASTLLGGGYQQENEWNSANGNKFTQLNKSSLVAAIFSFHRWIKGNLTAAELRTGDATLIVKQINSNLINSQLKHQYCDTLPGILSYLLLFTDVHKIRTAMPRQQHSG